MIIYVFEGSVELDDQVLEAGFAAELSQEEANDINIYNINWLVDR